MLFLSLQLSENSSLLSAEDTTSERVRFDDNISFIDDATSGGLEEVNTDNTSLSGRLLNKVVNEFLTTSRAFNVNG